MARAEVLSSEPRWWSLCEAAFWVAFGRRLQRDNYLVQRLAIRWPWQKERLVGIKARLDASCRELMSAFRDGRIEVIGRRDGNDVAQIGLVLSESARIWWHSDQIGLASDLQSLLDPAVRWPSIFSEVRVAASDLQRAFGPAQPRVRGRGRRRSSEGNTKQAILAEFERLRGDDRYKHDMGGLCREIAKKVGCTDRWVRQVLRS